jgi:hypothetical protein
MIGSDRADSAVLAINAVTWGAHGEDVQRALRRALDSRREGVAAAAAAALKAQGVALSEAEVERIRALIPDPDNEGS